MLRSPALLTLLMTLGAQPMPASEIEIDGSRSVFAVVTHKGGLAASQAHNHLVVAPAGGARLAFDPETPLHAEFELGAACEDLEIDDTERQRTWYPRLEALGILDEPFSDDISDKDRGKIRQAMLSKKQLDSARFASLEARVTALAETPSTVGDTEFPYAATLALTVHGKTVEKQTAARYELSGGTLTVEAVGTFSFTDFDIEPYSAAFGLVKNLDEFHVYLHLEGRLPESPEPGD